MTVRRMHGAWIRKSVDLNAYLALECKLLKKFAGIFGE